MDAELSSKKAEIASTICYRLSEILSNPSSESAPKSDIVLGGFILLNDESDEEIVLPSFTFGESFQKEFARLFYGVGEDTISLSSSFWLDAKDLLCQETTLRVSRLYAESGLGNHSNMPPDSLSVEVGFLGHLIAHKEFGNAKTFLEREILSWWPLVMKKISKEPRNEEVLEFFESIDEVLKTLDQYLDREDKTHSSY